MCYTKSYNNFESLYNTDLKLTNNSISSIIIILKNNNNENIIKNIRFLKNLQEINLKPEDNMKKMYFCVIYAINIMEVI